MQLLSLRFYFPHFSLLFTTICITLVLQLLPISPNQLCYSFWYVSSLSGRLNSLPPSLSWAIRQGTNDPCHQCLAPEQRRLIALYFEGGTQSVCFTRTIKGFWIPSLILLVSQQKIRRIYLSYEKNYSGMDIFHRKFITYF